MIETARFVEAFLAGNLEKSLYLSLNVEFCENIMVNGSPCPPLGFISESKPGKQGADI